MPPKKQKQKMTLGDFLENKEFGSWADEMENLPTAPAARAPDDAPSDRFGRGGDRDFSSRPDRAAFPPREDLPLPTAPPFTAFVGNLAFDLVEDDLAQFFAPESLKSVKVLRDKDDKPRGFGYVEFETLDGLKSGLAKSGNSLNSRVVRVSVAEPPKERESRFTSFGGDSSDWRRDGPLPDRPGPRSRFEDRPPREPVEPSEADTASDWRSSQPARSSIAPSEPSRRSGSGFRDAPPRGELNWERKATMAEMAAERPSNMRRGSGMDREPSAAETDEVWQRGPPRASIQTEEPLRRGGFGRGEGSGFGSGGPPDAGDWRSQMKGPTRQGSTDNKSPTSSQPQTPQGGRKRLDLLPRSTGGSNVPSPLSSPRMASATGPKASPFGAAKPVDVTSRDREINEKLERERDIRSKDKSGFGSGRAPVSRQGSTSGGPPTRDRSPAGEEEKKERAVNRFDAKAAQVRATTSFAAAAGSGSKKDDPAVNEAAEKLAEVTV